MKRCRLGITLLMSLFISQVYLKPIFAQEAVIPKFEWVELDSGLYFCETDAPEKSINNDSKLTIVKIDPLNYDFDFLTATEFGNKLRPADEWASEFNLQIVINAGMYSLKKNNPNKGYLKSFDHLNNPTLSGYYNAMMVSHPIDSSYPAFKLVDITCTPWDSIKNCYHSFCQGMRMIDCDGTPMAYDKKPDQSCSMIILSTDSTGMIYIFFTRSPYTHQKMIYFLKSFPFDLRQTVYLEGGPEASLFIKTKNVTISKYGTYVSKTWEKDDNDHFWEIPNIIGIRKKSF